MTRQPVVFFQPLVLKKLADNSHFRRVGSRCSQRKRIRVHVITVSREYPGELGTERDNPRQQESRGRVINKLCNKKLKSRLEVSQVLTF